MRLDGKPLRYAGSDAERPSRANGSRPLRSSTGTGLAAATVKALLSGFRDGEAPARGPRRD